MPVGSFVIEIVEHRHLDTVRGHTSTRVATVGDLPVLAPLLSDLADATGRIERGNLCIWTADDLGRPAGLVWVNTVDHADRFLGAWTRPTEGRPYSNQLLVREDMRSRGVGTQLMAGALAAARDIGATALRGTQSPGNPASVRLLNRLGFVVVARVQGVRLGKGFTARISWKTTK